MTQRALKHRDWVKIVHRRHEQNTQALKKKKQRTNTTAKCTLVAVAMLVSFFSIKEIIKPDQSQQLTSAQKQSVQQHFSRALTMGNWRLNHIDFKQSAVKVYINLPKALALDEPFLTRYIQATLCPKGNAVIWQAIDNKNLFIHLFTGVSFNRGQFVKCQKSISH